MRNIYLRIILISAFLFAGISSYAQNNFFNDAKETDIKDTTKRVIIPSKYRLIRLDTTALLNFLQSIPAEKFIADHNNTPVISIPMPDGSLARFHIWRTSIMEATLAAKYPDIITYTGQGIDDRSATIKIDWTALGFHAMILSPITTSIFIDPYQQGNMSYYISYLSSTLTNTETFREEDPPLNTASIHRPAIATDARPVNGSSLSRPASALSFEPSSSCIATQLRTYRIAIACTGEYAIAATGHPHPTVAQTLSAIVTTLNRVDGVYELELDIHFTLVGTEDNVIFTDPNTDPFPFSPVSDLNYPQDIMFQSQYVIDSLIGDANYDLGQTFNTAGGGLTSYNGSNTLGIVCVSGYKSTCEIGLTNPVGDVFNIDYVSHETGHEFGAYHSFNSVLGYCGAYGQFSNISNSEPGSGTTIMCYAEGPVANDSGLCGKDNLQVHSDPDFNALGFDEITAYSISGNGNSCATVTATSNTAPAVDAGADYTIPLSTPFILTGSATDINIGDVLTYSWEQVDIGGPPGTWNNPSGDAPIFRSFPPVTVPWRYFPKLSDVINNDTTIGEILPSYARTMHFRLTVRDNHAGGGGVCNDENIITVDGSSGPFKVTYPDTTNIVWQVGDLQTVTWNPAGTATGSVNCSNVLIELSTDGGLTYSDTLLASTPNTGSAQILVPDSITSTARVRVFAVGNVFYDISDNNFTIQFPPGFFSWINFTAAAQTNNTVLLNWTVDEVNSSYYSVERSTDGINFTPIDSLPANIVGSGSNDTYSFTDQNPLLGTSYYRIKEVNQLGGYSYSPIDPVILAQVPSSWTIYPTVARGSSITVVSNENSNNTVFQFFDDIGRLIYQDEVGQTTTGQSITIPVNMLAKGVYVLKITGTSGGKSKKIAVE
jgi:reprolysin-like metallo-peptidase family M12B/type IX secretion system substrate protein